jgi:hypothetical protein
MSASSLTNRLHRPGLRACGRGNLGNGFARVCGHARSIRATRRTSLPYPIILVHPVQHVESATAEPGEKLVTGEAPAAAAVAWSAAVAPSPAASAACAPSLLPLFVATQNDESRGERLVERVAAVDSDLRAVPSSRN